MFSAFLKNNSSQKARGALKLSRSQLTSEYKLFLRSSLSRKSLSQNIHTGKVFNIPRSFTLRTANEQKPSETAEFNYKHSINLLNALPRLRHHSHLWHFIFNSFWKLKTHKYAFCISQLFFTRNIWNDRGNDVYFVSSYFSCSEICTKMMSNKKRKVRAHSQIPKFYFVSS